MKRRLFDYGITALAAATAAFVKEEHFNTPGQEHISYGASIISGIIVFSVLHCAIHCFSKGLRLNPRFGYLGWWIEDIAKSSSSKHYSLFEVKHDIISDCFRVTGNTYDAKTHEPFADWGSTAVAFSEDNTLYYLHKSVIHGRAGDISGITRLNFVGSSGRYYEGTGYLIDNGEPLERVHFSFERLDNAEIKRHIGKRHLSKKSDRQAFVRKWLEERCRNN
jgi:hypothetical protein